ncbi:MAG TPA: hypothetical protein VKQ32_08275 [Polyangia bacterium]|nr:hypothetical protein [Polyangia bacterium]
MGLRTGLLATLATAAAWPPAARAADEAPPPAPATAAFVPGEGFTIASPDGAYKLRPGLNAAYKFEPRFLDGHSQNRDTIYAVRPFLRGNLLRPWIRFLTEAELAQNPPYLLYSYLEIRPLAGLGARIGQQNTPFSRHENFGFTYILFPDTDAVAEYFWTGRDKGVTAFGDLGSERIEYQAGVYAGSPLRQFTTIAGNYVVEARVAFNPLGKPGAAEFAYVLGEEPAPLRPSFALQGYTGNVQDATENFNPSSFKFEVMPSGVTTRETAAGADAVLQSRCVMLTAEAYGRRTTPEGGVAYTSFGAWGQAGVLLWARRLDAAVRVSWADPSTSLAGDRFLAGEAQITWYVSAPALIVKLRYGLSDQKSPGTAALGDVSLPANAGRLQIVTAQVNLAL